MNRYVAAALILLVCTPVRAEPADALLARALTCDLRNDELASLTEALEQADPGFKAPAHRYALPTYNLYRTSHPITAYGHSSDEIVMQPGRVVMLIPLKERAAVEQTLRLENPSEYLPSSRDVGESRSNRCLRHACGHSRQPETLSGLPVRDRTGVILGH